jgi:valyl-tRNA synthetase
MLSAATQELENLNFGQYVQLVYDFVWGEYCDWYLEWAKEDLYRGSDAVRSKTQNVLVYILSGILKVLHPVAPFITEEIWNNLPVGNGEHLIVTPWPTLVGEIDEEAEENVVVLQELVREIRYLRAELGISPGERCRVHLNFSDSSTLDRLRFYGRYIEQLSKCIIEEMGTEISKPEHVAMGRVPGVDVYLLVEGLVDVEKELERLTRKLLNVEQEIQKVRSKVENQDFVERAPQDVVEKEKERLRMLLEEKVRLEVLRAGMQ